jgi:hypothetical protein
MVGMLEILFNTNRDAFDTSFFIDEFINKIYYEVLGFSNSRNYSMFKKYMKFITASTLEEVSNDFLNISLLIND